MCSYRVVLSYVMNILTDRNHIVMENITLHSYLCGDTYRFEIFVGHDIPEILLKLELNINQLINQSINDMFVNDRMCFIETILETYDLKKKRKKKKVTCTRLIILYQVA